MKHIVFVLVLAVSNFCTKENLGLPVGSILPVSAITGTTERSVGNISFNGDDNNIVSGNAGV